MQTTIPYPSTARFPDEIVIHILRYLTPLEVVRLRLVSKQFHGVARDTQLWRVLYANSRLPRPPGPFLWQPRQSLERILIDSERISQSWTSKPLGIVSSLQGLRIPTEPSSGPITFKCLFGRLLILSERDRIFVHDVDTGVGRLLWEDFQAGHISSLGVCSLNLPDGKRVYIALRHLLEEPVSLRPPIKLLEFPVQDDGSLTLGPMIHSMDLPVWANFPMSASGPCLYFGDNGLDKLSGGPWKPLIIDVRTRAMYTCPAPIRAITEFLWCPLPTFPSGMHVAVFHHYPWFYSSSIQTFTASDPQAHSSDGDACQLSVTHEALASSCPAPARFLRSAVVDQATGNANIRLLNISRHGEEAHFHCIDIMIPPVISASTEVLPMIVDIQDLFVLPGRERTVFFDSSEDGHGRGFITLTAQDSQEPLGADHPVVLYKFSVDASGEHCTAAVSEPCRLSPEDHFDRCVFDGFRGRVYHKQEGSQNSFDLVLHNIH